MFKRYLLILACVVASSVAVAEPWKPSGTIQIVVPYPVGGSTDKWGRVVADILSDHGWNTIVLNKPGANGVIGANYAANTKSNDTILFLMSPSIDANVLFKDKDSWINYNENSFTNITPLGSSSLVLAVANNVPVNNYKEFKTYVKANPTKFNLGFYSMQTANLFYKWAEQANLPKPTIILYKGSVAMETDLAGGHIPFIFDSYGNTTMLANIDAKKIKIIAIIDTLGYNRLTKEIPNFKVANISRNHPDLDVPMYYGIVGQADLSKGAVYEINRVINDNLKNPKYTESLRATHYGVEGGSPDQLSNIRVKTINALKLDGKGNQ